MNENTIKIRLMKAIDFDAVVGIDEKVLKTSRPEYYEVKFEKLFESKDYLPASLVAEEEDGTVVGFVMGEIYMGEYGIFEEEANVGVKKINTLVDWNDSKLIHFFSLNQFSPSKTINLERSI
ncbi:MAG: hypothetical protein JRI92_09315 [Deltaproteobacteria bacterium]|nr:hypothetical protein [Deltaproteobacteria bacterium]